MARLLHRLGMLCARKPLIVIGVWVVLLVVVFGAVAKFGSQHQQRPLPAGHRQPGGQGPAAGQVPAPAERRQPDRLRRHVRASSPTTQTSRRSSDVRQGDQEAAPRLQRHQPAQQRRPDRRAALQGQADRVRAGAAGRRLRRPRPRRSRRTSSTRPSRPGRPASRSAAAGSIGTTLSDRASREQRDRRHPRRDDHPQPGARQPGRDGHADHHRRRRARRRARRWSACSATSSPIPTSGPTLATMIGLGVGIDYALFLVTRHQEQLARRHGDARLDRQRRRDLGQRDRLRRRHRRDRAGLAAASPGIPLVSALGLASAVAVVTAVLGAITLLPALLGLLEHRIDWASLPAFLRRRTEPGAGDVAPLGRRRTPAPGRASPSSSLAFLVPLIIPVFSLELGQEDIGATPGHHRAPGLRPDHRRLRRRLQRPAPGRLGARARRRRRAPSTPRSTTRRRRCRRSSSRSRRRCRSSRSSSSSSRSSSRRSRQQLEPSRATQLKAPAGARSTQQGDQLQGRSRRRWSSRARSSSSSRPQLEAQKRKLEQRAGRARAEGRGAGRRDPAARRAQLGRLEARERVLRAAHRRTPRATRVAAGAAAARGSSRVLAREAEVRTEARRRSKKQAEQLAAQARELQAQAAALQQPGRRSCRPRPTS